MSLHDDEDLAEALPALLTQLAAIEPQPAQRERLRARLLQRAGRDTAVQDAFFTIRAEEGRWHDIFPGVRLKLLFRDRDTQTFLLDVAANTVVPTHDHPTNEECFVLQGEAFIGDLRLVGGDYHFARQGSLHQGLRSDTGAQLLIRTGAEGPRVTQL